MWPFSRLSDEDARRAAPGRHAAGRNLWLRRAEDGTAVWEVTLTFRGSCWDVCLGSYPDLNVAQAQSEAAKWRGMTRMGLDPDAEQEAFRDAAARNFHQFYC